MFKKTFLSIASSAALLGAVAAPASASSKFFLVVPLNAKAQVQEPAEAITVSLAGAALPRATLNQPYSESLRPYLSVTGDVAFDPAATRWSLAGGSLPAGLTLDPIAGQIAGTSSVFSESGASFEVSAEYKGKRAQQAYTLQVAKPAAGCYAYLQANPGAASGWYTLTQMAKALLCLRATTAT